MKPITYHTDRRLPDALLATVQEHTSLEDLLAWASNITDMVQQDEFHSDIVVRVEPFWLVYDVT